MTHRSLSVVTRRHPHTHMWDELVADVPTHAHDHVLSQVATLNETLGWEKYKPHWTEAAMAATATARLIEERLTGWSDLRDYVAAHRRDGESWEYIARELYIDTKVAVSGETLRHWYPTF